MQDRPLLLSEMPPYDPRPWWVRYPIALLNLVRDNVGWLAISSGGVASLMLTTGHLSLAIYFVAIALFFGIAWVLLTLRDDSGNPLVWCALAIYLLLAIPTTPYLAWWIPLSQVGKTIKINTINSSDWDIEWKQGNIQTNLRGFPIFQHWWPPTLHATFIPDKVFGLPFELQQNEIGYAVGTGTLTIKAPNGIEVRNDATERKWIRRGNSISTDYGTLYRRVPEPITGLVFRATKRGQFTFQYYLDGISQDANGKYESFKINGRFAVRLR